MSQNTCLELAEAPEGDGCKNNARKVSNKKNRKQYECTTDQELQHTQRANDVTCTGWASGQLADAAAETAENGGADIIAANLKV